mgnify:FL=1
MLAEANTMINDRITVDYRRGPKMQLDINPSWVCLIEEKGLVAIANRINLLNCNYIALFNLKSLKPVRIIPCNFQFLRNLRYVPELRCMLAFGKAPSAQLMDIDAGFKKCWSKTSDGEIFGIDFALEEKLVLAVGKFDGVKIWKLDDPEFEEHKLQDIKLFGQTIVYVKGIKKVVLFSHQRVAIASWPELSVVTFVEEKFGVHDWPIHSLSYLPEFRSFAIFYLYDKPRLLWRIVDGKLGDSQTELEKKAQFPFELAGACPGIFEPIAYFNEKNILGMGKSGALAISRIPDGMIQTHLEDNCAMKNITMWNSRNKFCFIGRSGGHDPLFNLQFRLFNNNKRK